MSLVPVGVHFLCGKVTDSQEGTSEMQLYNCDSHALALTVASTQLNIVGRFSEELVSQCFHCMAYEKHGPLKGNFACRCRLSKQTCWRKMVQQFNHSQVIHR